MAKRVRQHRQHRGPDETVATALVSMPVAVPPVPPVPFLGREPDLIRVQSMLTQDRVVLLTGIAGSGKSALAATVLHQTTRPCSWLRIVPGLTDTAEAFLWHLAQPLAQLVPDAWQSFHQAHQARRHYPLFVFFQAILSAYRRTRTEILLCVYGIDHAVEPALVSLLVELGTYVQQTQASHLTLLLVGRRVPYRLKLLPTVTLAGLPADAVMQWARQCGVDVNRHDAAQILQQTDGLPGAIAALLVAMQTQPDVLHTTGIVDQVAMRQFVNDLFEHLSATEQALITRFAREDVGITDVPFDHLGAVVALEDQHLVHATPERTWMVHPLVQAVMEHFAPGG